MFWNDSSLLFKYFIDFIMCLNSNAYNSYNYKFYLVTLYCTYTFVFFGFSLFLKLLFDSYSKKIIKHFKYQLLFLRKFLIYNIYIFYYPILRK